MFEKSYHQSQTPQDRVRLEHRELKERRDKLIDFLQKGQPAFIDDKNWTLLEEQCDAMNWYYTILGSRIELF
ncbi:crAss001_48 related protein [Acinetobacter sp. 1125_18A]|uniref:crAss001_48 related protein n=1 Tax=Acinetobacter sp. 1125_18A TaxID=2605959 RepID=UPI004059F110